MYKDTKSCRYFFSYTAWIDSTISFCRVNWSFSTVNIWQGRCGTCLSPPNCRFTHRDTVSSTCLLMTFALKSLNVIQITKKMYKCPLCRGKQSIAPSPAGFHPIGRHFLTDGMTTRVCLRELGAVDEFVKLKPGKASAAKTTTVEIVKVNEHYMNCRNYLVIGMENP